MTSSVGTAVRVTTGEPAHGSPPPPDPDTGIPGHASPASPAERRMLVVAVAARYAEADKREKTQTLDWLCAATGWHRSHARKALLTASRPRPADPPRGQAKYDTDVVAALRLCWTVLDKPAGKRLAPALPELVPVLRRHKELDIDDATAKLLTEMSAATIDRRLAPHRRPARRATRIRAGSLTRNEVPLVTWSEWDNTRPGFMEITVVGHDGGAPGGDHLHTVSATDIATGWTENRTVRMIDGMTVALDEIARMLPFPILGLDSGNHDTGADDVLQRWCGQRRVTFTHARPARNGSHHVGQKNWSMLHAVADERRYDTTAELVLLNKIWAALSGLSNYFCPQQHSVPAGEQAERRRKEYDTATPYHRTSRHSGVTTEDKTILADIHACTNPAELHRRIEAMTRRLHLMAADKAAPGQLVRDLPHRPRTARTDSAS
ncbi:hypothetical protein OG705_34950 [Streptomyces sp. NBC_00838]|uniref:hypothetical protein n=1 Tax=Streptomyces sp. NBC_00838 TaxID=2903680 RepID=UPI00386E2C47|nr:hypothetical protein OG705_34950 [Streptomyces sp. NBC_00838]